MKMKEVYEYVDQNYQDFIQDLVKVIKQPSVSAEGEGMQECAETVEKMPRNVGFSAESQLQRISPSVPNQCVRA